MLQAGDSIARYRIELLLGEGAMGSVYRAVDPHLQRRIALKVLRVDSPGADTSEGRERLLREARAAAAFHHPNAISVFDAGTADGVVYVAMEYVKGSTLREVLQRPDVPWRRRLGWLLDIARALGAAHKVGIVHRDVKPENVMVSEEGVIKVLDFGIARRAAAPTDPSAATEAAGLSTLTEAGALVGTPLYMAPEQLQAGAIDGRADQFAWGVLAYELLSGTRPWGTPTSVYALVSAMLSEEPQPLALAIAELPAHVSSAIAKALGRDREERFSSMEALVQELELQALDSVPKAQPRPSVASPSLEPASAAAARAYSEGMQLFHDGAGHTAERSLERALELEPALAAAHLRLALRMLPSQSNNARKHYQKAFQHRASLGERDRALLEASEPYLRVRSDFVEWERRLAVAVAQYADNAELQVWLGTALAHQGKQQAALVIFERALALDRTFIPAWRMKARALMALGKVEASLAACDDCMRTSPAAAECLEERIRSLKAVGECEQVEADAKSWVAIEPDSPDALYALAEALATRGAPYESVQTLLARRWRLPGIDRETEDRLDLALLRGDFVDAERLLLTWQQRALDLGTTVADAFHPTLGLLGVYLETGRDDRAADVADACLKRLSAFAADPLGSDPSLRLRRHLLRGGRISASEYATERAAWLAERSQGRRPSVLDWVMAYVATIEREDEAREALDALSAFLPLPPEPWPNHLYALIGKVHVLVQAPSQAIPLLRRAACACSLLSTPVVHITASYYLGRALKDTGDLVGARKAFQVVVDRWGRAQPRSLTAEKAEMELIGLG